MTFAELLVRWAIIIAFGLLAFVTAIAGVLILQTGQAGNPTLLFAIAVVSVGVALWLHRTLRQLRTKNDANG
jgi:uncharacterized membrane protein YfcA